MRQSLQTQTKRSSAHVQDGFPSAMIQGKKAIEDDLKARDFGNTIAKTAACLRDVTVVSGLASPAAA